MPLTNYRIIKQRFRTLTNLPTRWLVEAGFLAIHLTLIGCAASIFAAMCLAYGQFLVAAIALIIAGVCDMLDGQVARAGDHVSPLGAFLDSTLDRFSEAAVLVGATIYGAQLVSQTGHVLAAILPALALGTSLLISYIRARAEGLGLTCAVGLMERPERMVLTILAVGASVAWPMVWPMALGLMTVLNVVTIVQRTIHVARQLLDEPNERTAS